MTVTNEQIKKTYPESSSGSHVRVRMMRY